MARRIACAACALVLAEALLTVARAQTTPTGAPLRSAPVVELIVIGGGSDAVVLIGTVNQLLGGLGIATESHAVVAPEDVLSITRGAAAARVQVDLREADAVVIVTEGHGQTSAQRRLRRDPSAAVTREEVAQAIESAVEAEIMALSAEVPRDGDAGPDGIAPAPAETPASAISTGEPSQAPTGPISSPSTSPAAADRTAAPESAGRLSVDLSARAGAGWFASGMGPLPELEGDLALAWRDRWRPSIVLAVRGTTPSDSSSDSLTARAAILGSRLLGRLDVVRSSWLALSPGVGGGVDFLFVQPQSSAVPGSALRPATSRADAVVTGFIGARVALVPRLSLDALLAADFDLSPPRYVVLDGGASDDVLSPWRVRPVLLLGLTFVFGAQDFASHGAQ
jgi:hypothetical protein